VSSALPRALPTRTVRLRRAVVASSIAFLLGLTCGLTVTMADEPTVLRTVPPRNASLVGLPGR
jgi:hypothetical protein